MGEKREIKEKEIIENVLRAELDFITYVDVDTGIYHTIITDVDTDVAPPLYGDYAAVNETTIPKYVHPDDQEQCKKALFLPNIIEELRNKDHIVVFYRLLCGSSYRRKALSIYYHGEDEKTIVMVRRDVTDSYEEEQRQNERLYDALMDARHANQEKNGFLERMSHGIRTPMNSIIGLSYLTKEYVGNEKQVLENLDKINKSAHFLLSFIDDILNLSQIESGNVAMVQQDVELDSFLAQIAHKVEKWAKPKQIVFGMERRGDFDKEYSFDADQLGKALLNILSNAVKYTPQEGRVDFIAERLYDADEEATIRFEIRDNGIGIDAAFLPYIYDPFEQENENGTTLNGGTGLGLSIARNIIEFMGGKIDAYSEKGKGATFVVTVTLQKVADYEMSLRKQSKSEKLDYDFEGKRVLLVEDNEVNIEITRNILTHKNLEVEVAVNGEEGVNAFLSHEPGYYDVILMDIRMPVMDGLTATKKIRSAEHEDSKRIPIIAMTANVFEEDVRKSFEAGMDAHLSKPVDIRQIYFVLDSMIYG